MPELSQADHSATPPRITIPRSYNFAHDLIERNLVAGRGEKLAYIDDQTTCSYAELAARVNQAANMLTGLGLRQEDRILISMQDSIDFPTVFLGAIKAGIVPVATNTLLTAADYDYMLGDSRAQALIVSAAVWPLFKTVVARHPRLRNIVIAGNAPQEKTAPPCLADLLALESSSFDTAPTSSDDACFWIYSSGSTGMPKGTVHLHSHPMHTAELYARPVLGINENDIIFSAAKLFFAYGLGNSLTFPLSVGATALLMAERPTSAATFERLQRHRPTVFFGVPTLYASILADPSLPDGADLGLRLCASAGEALPADLGRRWRERFGIDILDGIGSTEMLNTFLSNRPDDVRYGTTGKPVPGYHLRLVDDNGQEVAPGELGELQINGPSAALMYWNNRTRTKDTFLGHWTRSGDKFTIDDDGYFTYCGRNDDMLKVSGIYVSPAEVEATLMQHDAVLEAAVVAHADDDGLIKPKAYVVLKSGMMQDEAMRTQLKQHVKQHLAPYKYPRWIEFRDELPKTATGKIQRFKLREGAGFSSSAGTHF
jgi:benzoate-CoA ligase